MASETGPNCPACSQRGSLTRVATLRAYIRVQVDGERAWQPIGWYCRFCGGLQPPTQVAPFDDGDLVVVKRRRGRPSAASRQG